MILIEENTIYKCRYFLVKEVLLWSANRLLPKAKYFKRYKNKDPFKFRNYCIRVSIKIKFK
jgi:hypothetical protein